METWSIADYLARLSARHPTPAGAAVAALNLAQAAALLAMVARVRVGDRGPDAAVPGAAGPEHAGPEDAGPEDAVPEDRGLDDRGHAALGQADQLREAAMRLAVDDARALEGVAAAYALPRSTAEERERRTTAIADALLAAAGPAARAVPIGAELIGLCEWMAGAGAGAVLADVAAAADAAAAAVSISRTNVEVDIGPRRGADEAEHLAAALAPVDELLRRAARVRDGIRRALA